MREYRVKLNRQHPVFKNLAFYCFAIFLIGFIALYFIDYPARYLPIDLTLFYYFEFLPNWMTKSLGIMLLFLPLAFAVDLIKINRNCKIEFNNESILIKKQKKKTTKVDPVELKRISFIVSPFSLYPYRIELNFKKTKRFFRFRIKNKEDFYNIIEDVNSFDHEVECYFSAFESSEQEINTR